MAKSKTADKKKTEVKAVKTKKTVAAKPANSSKSSKSTTTTTKTTKSVTKKVEAKKSTPKVVKGQIKEVKPATKTKKVETKKKTTTKRGSSLSAYKDVHVDRTVEGDEEGEFITAGESNGKAAITIHLPFNKKNMKFLDSKDLLKILKEAKKLLTRVRVASNARGR